MIKKGLLISLCLISLNTLTYASFPSTGSPTEQLSESNTKAIVSTNYSESWWGELHWAWKAVIIIINLYLSIYIFALLWIVRSFP